jgi:hypothetical protein
MRFWIGGPRIGWFRPGVSFSAQELGMGRERTRARPSKEKGSFVYVIRGDHHMCKIGVSTNPTARLATLRNGSPFPLSFAFIGATDGANGFAIEQKTHRVLDKHRVEGEWFDIPEELAIATVWAAAASLGEKMATVDPSRVDEVIRLCASDERERQPLILRILVTLIYLCFSALFILLIIAVAAIMLSVASGPSHSAVICNNIADMIICSDGSRVQKFGSGTIYVRPAQHLPHEQCCSGSRQRLERCDHCD